MCCSRYSVVDSLAPIVSRPAELSRSSASEFSSSCCRFWKRRAYSSTIRPASVSIRSLPERSISFSPEFRLQPLHRQRDRRLRAQQLLGRARKALLRRDRQKHLEGIEFHDGRYYNIAIICRPAKIINLPNLDQRRIMDVSAMTYERSSIYLRYDSAGWRAVAGLQHDRAEKLRMARKLVELGVDILEAGFPIASEGDFEAVDAVSREFPWAQVAALARCCTLDVERAAKSLEARQAAAHPHLHRHQRHPPQVQAEEDRSSRCWTKPSPRSNWRARYVDDVEFSAEDGARTDPDYLEKISKAVVAAGARTVNIPGHRRLLDARRIRRADRPHREGAGRLRHRQRALP